MHITGGYWEFSSGDSMNSQGWKQKQCLRLLEWSENQDSLEKIT